MLAEACEDYIDATHRRLSFEWALIDGVNDTARHARELADYARPLRAHVNLIPLNPTPGYAVRGTPPAGVRDFAEDAHRPRRQRHDPANPRHRHRRGLRSVAGFARSDFTETGQPGADAPKPQVITTA